MICLKIISRIRVDTNVMEPMWVVNDMTKGDSERAVPTNLERKRVYKRIPLMLIILSSLSVSSESVFAKSKDTFYCPSVDQLTQGEDGIIRGTTTGDLAIPIASFPIPPGFLDANPYLARVQTFRLPMTVDVSCTYKNDAFDLAFVDSSFDSVSSEKYDKCYPNDYDFGNREPLDPQKFPMTCTYGGPYWDKEFEDPAPIEALAEEEIGEELPRKFLPK